MACVPDDREGAVREVSQVYELIKIQQPLLLLHCCDGQPTATLAHSLLSEALRALNVALSVMKQQQPATGPVSSSSAEPQLSPSSPAATDSKGVTSTARRGKRRRSVFEGNNSSWVNLTTVPYEDGYEWRKYGEKRINGTHFTRSYFRCTYKDNKGCMATKQIQQKDNSDPPVFQVTYNNEHTCNCTVAATAAKKNSSNSSSNNLPFLGYYNSEGAINPPNDVRTMVKQEPSVLPPLVEVSALPLDQTTFQEPLLPISNQVYGTVSAHPAVGMPSATSATDSSCITGVSCDEYFADMMGQMPAQAMEPAGDDPLRNLELFLLYDSFNYY